MDNGAVLSESGLYRFNLWRSITPTLFDGNLGDCLFVMNNPSTADATKDDNTIRRVKAFAASWGFSKVYVLNTNPHRSTNPKLAQVPPPNILRLNDKWLSKLAKQCQWVVAAWGGEASPLLAKRALDVLLAIKPVRAIELSKHGIPKHPLYLPKDAKPFIWKDAA